MKLSSQKHLDADTIEEKRAAQDYTVTLATIIDPTTDVDYDLVIDGHHSYAAALLDGVAPEYVFSDYNYQSEVECIGFDDFLAAHYIDSDWYDLETGNPAY